MSSTRSNVLWCALQHTGELIGVKGWQDQRFVVCLFSSPFRCEEWIMGMRLEQAVASTPLFANRLVGLLRDAKQNGWDLATLDPPPGMRGAFELSPVENIIAQAEAKIDALKPTRS